MWKCKETEVSIMVKIKTCCQCELECPLTALSSQPTYVYIDASQTQSQFDEARIVSPRFKPRLGNVWPSGTNLNKNTLQPTSLYSQRILCLHRRVTTTEPVRHGADRQPQGSNLSPAVPDLLVPIWIKIPFNLLLFTADGYYVYIDASQPQSQFDEARIVSPRVQTSARQCLTFWYHMLGQSMGTFNAYVRRDGPQDVLLWSQTGEQSGDWQRTSIRLTESMAYQV